MNPNESQQTQRLGPTFSVKKGRQGSKPVFVESCNISLFSFSELDPSSRIFRNMKNVVQPVQTNNPKYEQYESNNRVMCH